MTYAQGFAALLAILLLVPALASLFGRPDSDDRNHDDRRDGAP